MFRETSAPVRAVSCPDSRAGVLLPNMSYADVIRLCPPECIEAGRFAKAHDDHRGGKAITALLIGTAFCLGMAGYAVKSGTLIMRGRYERELSPIWFWFGTTFYAIAGLAFLVLLLMQMVKRGG